MIVVSTGTHPEANANAETGLQNRHEKGYSFIIILRCHNKKTSKIDTVRFEPHPPFYMPTVLEARHWGATYALYRVKHLDFFFAVPSNFSSVDMQ